MRAEMPAELIT